jgi:hypothetical protein
MAEGDCTFYNHWKELTLLGTPNHDTDTFQIVLLGAGYSFTPDGNNGYANVSANEITAAGYTAGGKTIANPAVTQDDTNNWAKWDGDDVTWTSLATAAIAHAVIYDQTITTPVNDPLVCRFEITTASNGGNYQLAFNAGGIAQLA